MDKYSSQGIRTIISKEGNSKCFDCGIEGTKWVSINNAVFLCKKCAKVHVSFLKSISTVKSLEVHSFTQREIDLMRIGGNQRFSTLLAEYGITINSTKNKEFKYHLVIAQYYRDLLQDEINRNNNQKDYGVTFIKKPNVQKGLELLKSIKDKKELGIGDFFISVESMFKKVGKVIGDKAYQMGIITKFKEVFTSFNESNPNEKTNEITRQKTRQSNEGNAIKDNNSNIIQDLVKKAEEQYIALKEKNEQYKKGNTESQQNLIQESDPKSNMNTNIAIPLSNQENIYQLENENLQPIQNA